MRWITRKKMTAGHQDQPNRSSEPNNSVLQYLKGSPNHTDNSAGMKNGASNNFESAMLNRKEILLPIYAICVSLVVILMVFMWHLNQKAEQRITYLESKLEANQAHLSDQIAKLEEGRIPITELEKLEHQIVSLESSVEIKLQKNQQENLLQLSQAMSDLITVNGIQKIENQISTMQSLMEKRLQEYEKKILVQMNAELLKPKVQPQMSQRSMRQIDLKAEMPASQFTVLPPAISGGEEPIVELPWIESPVNSIKHPCQ